MSELAYNLQGERFEPPDTAAVWRVRRLKPGGRGTPDVVFGDDGAPLMLPIETELAQFRQLVNHEPGRYRLDPLDEDHRSCEGAMPAYLHVSDAQPAARAPVSVPSGGDAGHLMEMLVRANTEMVRSISEKFASVMESAAVLLRAADGAGLPAREPVVLQQPQAIEDEDEDEEPRNGGGSELGGFLSQVLPLVQMAVAQKLGAKKPRNAAPDDDTDDDVEEDESGESDELEGSDEASEVEVKPIGPKEMAHFAAIQQQLTLEESSLAQAVAAELSPREINAWIAQLCELSVEDAAALVRKTIASCQKGGES